MLGAGLGSGPATRALARLSGSALARPTCTCCYQSADRGKGWVRMSEPRLERLPEGLGERYGMELPARGQRLLGGATGGLVRAGEIVVRVECADPESVRWEHALLQFLAEEIEQVVAP